MAYSLQSVDSLPNPPARRDPQAFVTGGAYALLFLLGALEGLIGCFQFSRMVGSFPLVALVLAVVIGITCFLGAAGMESTAGALAPALGWFAVSVVLSLPTSGGSVIIANSTAGQVYLYGGSLCAAAGVVVAGVAGCSSVVSFLLHPTRRTNPKMQAKPQCVNRVVVVMMSLYLS